MTLIVEDGTGVADANTYVSVADHITFCAQYGVTVDSGAAEINLRVGMDFLETLDYQGRKEFTTNELSFPRLYMCVKGQQLTDLQSLAKIQRVQNEFGLGAAQGVNPLAIKDRVIQSETFGAFSRTYASGMATTPTNPRLELYLQPLLRNNKTGKFAFAIVNHKHYDNCNNPNNANGQGGYSYYDGGGYGVDPYYNDEDGNVL